MKATHRCGPEILSQPANQKKQDPERRFLDTYAKTGDIRAAAKAARIRLAVHHEKLERDPAYRKAFEAAQQQVVANGVEEDWSRWIRSRIPRPPTSVISTGCMRKSRI